jgi:hypothetical protein
VYLPGGVSAAPKSLLIAPLSFAAGLRLISGENGNCQSLLPFDHEASASFPVDFGKIEEMNEGSRGGVSGLP